ncbi:MAG: enoyl-CoA hydratase-related protein [Candidatus Limnocylindrales bacterium]
MSDGLRIEVLGGVATLTLDRPKALNALTIPLKRALLAALEGIAADRSVRAVVLTGAGRAFCAGQDLAERDDPAAPSLDVELRERYNPIVRTLRTMDQPVIAALNGVAAGAGASLAFACDIRIAAPQARFVLAFGRIGLLPDSGATWFLPRLLGAARAAELALSGDPVSAQDALRIGLVSRVVAADTLLAEARQMADALAAMAPLALAATKHAMERAWSVDLASALDDEAAIQGELGSTMDHAEGLAAFREKRGPRFKGT